MKNCPVTFCDKKISYYSIDILEKTGIVKAFFTSNKNSEWKFGIDGALENFKKLSSEFSVQLENICTTYQTHTDQIRLMSKDNGGEGVLRETALKDYDGIITSDKGLLLCSFEADCVPVYLLDVKKKVCGIVHSGWKGTLKQICKKAVEKMCADFESAPDDITCVIGPCACKNCYEVGPELKEMFGQQFAPCFDPLRGGEKYLLDMARAIELSLVDAGLNKDNIYNVDMCTIESRDLCSYRRTGSKTDHMLTAIMLV